MTTRTRRKADNLPSRKPILSRKWLAAEDSAISSLGSQSWQPEDDGGVYTSEEDGEDPRDTVFFSPCGSSLSLSDCSVLNGKVNEKGDGHRKSPPLKNPFLTKAPVAPSPPSVLAEDENCVYLSDHKEHILKKLSTDPFGRNAVRKPQNSVFGQFQNRVRTVLDSACRKSPKERRRLYEQISFLDVFDELCLSIYRIRAMVDSVFELVEEDPKRSFFCAEFCKLQMSSLDPGWRPSFFAAVLRCIRTRFCHEFSARLMVDDGRRRRFAYTTFLGHLYVVHLLPSHLLKAYVTELIEAKVNDEADFDSLTYVVRLLAVIGWTWDQESVTNQRQMSQWMACLASIVNCPLPLRYDVDRLLEQRPMGRWVFSKPTRCDNFEIRQKYDDVVFRTSNSFGRGLNASKEILAMYSPYFHQFFFADGVAKHNELHEVFIDVEFFVFREILSIIYNVNRSFTATGHSIYDTATLVELYYTANQLDIPLIRRLCREQLMEKPPLEAALVGQQLGLPEIVTHALKWMCPRDLHIFMENGIQDAELSARDVIIAARKMVRLQYRKLKPPPKIEITEVDAMFPSDFLSPWPLSDVILKTWNSGGRGLHANIKVLAMYSQTFARRIQENRMLNVPETVEVSLDMDFDILTIVLKVIHHVDRKFSYGGHEVLVRSTLYRLFKAAVVLEMPLLLQLCEDHLYSLPPSEHVAVAQIAQVPPAVIHSCFCPEQLIDEIRKAVRIAVCSSDRPFFGLR